MGDAWLAPNEQSVNRARSRSEEQSEPKKKKLHCKWGRWATMVAGTTSERTDDVKPSDEMDPALWGELYRYVNVEEMVVANLPLHAFYRALSVCKKWNALGWNRPFLQQWSKTSLPKPYFILYGDRGCHQAMLVQDATTQSWVLQQLPPFAFQQPLTSVSHGMVYTGTNENCIRGTVFNIHTKVFRRLPPLQSGCYAFSSILAVEKGSYKVVVSWDRAGVTHVYDSLTGTWTRRSDSPAFRGSVEEDYAYCEGVMYIKRDAYRRPMWHQALFAYDFNLDIWNVLARAPEGYGRLKGLGEWNGVLRDLSLDRKGVLRVWEYQLSGPEVEMARNHGRIPSYEWIEVECMPANLLKWFLEPFGLRAFLKPPKPKQSIKASYFEDYVLLSHSGFPENSGLARFVLYNMALRSWEALHVAKDWICSCPFSR